MDRDSGRELVPVRGSLDYLATDEEKMHTLFTGPIP